MDPLAPGVAVLAASTVTVVGAVIVALIVLGFALYVIVNIRIGREEVGSEIELAPNRKPFLPDDALETTRLNRTLLWAMVLLGFSAVGLPLYCLNEPSRQSGAVEGFDSTFVKRGEEAFTEGSQCANCHGPEGGGGQAPYTVLDAEGSFVAQVNWRAPALDTVLLRFSRDEVTYIINYGRPFSPMPGWGASVNKGPLNEQQISNIVDYLASIQLEPEEAQRQAQVALAEELGLLEEGETDEAVVDDALTQIDYGDPATGEALFTLETAGGAYACALCPNLTGVLIPRQFATPEELVAFITTGSVNGEQYGNNGIGSGKMPGFGD